MRAPVSVSALALAGVVALATPVPGPLGAQQVGATARTVELGADAAADFGLGDVSSVNITLPGSRFRAGFFMNPRWSIEPAAGFSYNKVEEQDGNLRYDLQVGALYHFRPFAVVAADGTGDVIVRVRSTYLRPFVQVVGFDAGDVSDSEFSAGAGLGVKIPWRTRLWWRLEANTGYGFDNEAFRLGAVAGLSYFIR